MSDLTWSELDARAVNTARILAADAVEKVGNGHPGTAISLAPLAYLLYQKVMRHDPADPKWAGRDRFVLSIGHSSLTQYTQLYLAGFGLELDDLKALRTEGSLTPGHPEYGHTAGVEVTTGPLGAGVANAVGFAMAARRERALLDPNTPLGAASPFDHFVYCITGDGCMQEGPAAEASSLAGTQKLGNLVVIYDDNRISIEGETSIAFTEDVAARYAAYGWHVQHVDWTNGGTGYTENLDALYEAIEAAKAVTDKPSFIKLTTVIGWPLPTKAGDHSVHGAKLGGDEIAALKKELGFDPAVNFPYEAEVLAHARANAATRAVAAKAEWSKGFDAWRAANPAQAELFDRLVAGVVPDLSAALPVFAPGKKATRAASGEVLSALAEAMPELWGGSADLAGSNNTTISGVPSFVPFERSTHEWNGDPLSGRVLHFGIREHGMAAIMNGIQVHGHTRVFGGTFFTFSDYMRGAVRVSALSKIPVIYVWTHDSIGLGEDGPTHQSIEHLASLRAMPGIDIVRPADANETAAAWLQILKHTDRPAGLVLTRQNVPTFPRGTDGFAGTEGVAKGGYVLLDSPTGDVDVVLLATGSEVQYAVAAREALQAEGIGARVVSLPCLEWFEAQEASYRDEVIPPSVKARVSIEAGVKQGWRDYVGDAGRIISIDHYGASADAATLFREFGFTPEAVIEAAKASIAEVNA
jgi:transketolase